MGWHLFVLHAAGPAATTGVLADTGYVATGLRMTADAAVADIDDLAPDGIAVASRPPGSGVLAIARFSDHDELALALSAGGGEARTFLWQGVTDTYVLSVFRDGRPFRRLVRADGELVVDEGPALPVEASVDWSDGEDTLFALAAAITGEPVGHDDWMAQPVVVHRRRRRASS
jgi:hypothetical protein